MSEPGAQVASFAEAAVHIAALGARCDQLAHRVRHVEKQLDTLGSPWWKRLWFRLDGWPAWWVVVATRAWRPWHAWTRMY